VLTGAGLLINDSDPEGDPLFAMLVSGPNRGTLISFDGSGGLRYRPEAGFIGTVQIVYQASDGVLLSDPITVTIQVIVPDNVPVNNSGSGSGSGAGTGSGNGASAQSNTSTTTTTVDQTIQTLAAAPPPVVDGSALSSASPATNAEVAKVEVLPFVPVESSLEKSSLLHTAFGIRSRESIRWFSTSAGHYEIQTHRSSDLITSHRMHQEEGTNHHDHEMGHQQIAMDSVLIKTVLGTGIILWLAQGAQLAATLISVSPAWMHIDPLSIMPNLDDKKGKKEELSEGEKLFDR
jgi:hypothetical protein